MKNYTVYDFFLGFCNSHNKYYFLFNFLINILKTLINHNLLKNQLYHHVKFIIGRAAMHFFTISYHFCLETNSRDIPLFFPGYVLGNKQTHICCCLLFPRTPFCHLFAIKHIIIYLFENEQHAR